MKKTFFALLCTLPLWLVGAGIDALENFNDRVRGFSGNFTQTVKNAKQTLKAQGRFAIVRPDRFYWAYEKPYRQTIVGDGATVWLYDEDLAQVTKRTQGRALGSSPAAMLSDKTALNADYTVKNDGESGGVAYFLALPKNDGGEYRSIRLGFKNDVPAHMTLKDNFGNTTDIDFVDVRLNPKLDDALFRFTPPPGVDVLQAD